METMSELAMLAQGINLLWVLIASFLIFFMKAGFAMLEAGQVRAKNVANQLTQTLLTLIVGLGPYFAVAAAVATLTGAATGTGGVDLVSAFASVYAPSGVN